MRSMIFHDFVAPDFGPIIGPGTKMVELVFKTLRPWVPWHWPPLGETGRDWGLWL